MTFPPTVLILGGTVEGSAIASALAADPRYAPILSLAGRTRTPFLPVVPGRTGGFGGVIGLSDYLRRAQVDAVVDAVHPFARQMHGHAAEAARQSGVPRVTVLRPAWVARSGDRWTEVESMAAAAAALGPVARRVLLTVGRQELAAFRAAPWHDYLVRSIETPGAGDLPAAGDGMGRVRCISARGPFGEADERALLAGERIEVLVTKNSGGEATAAKLAAARALGVPVVLVARPPVPAGPLVADAAGALAWLDQVLDQVGGVKKRGV